ncbi:cellulose biosynthesis cyclic di-GMP-binding regulatory protein BcsB [Pseudomonas jilinensis]|uniref:Cyclic di-GMP-binding protein n=1 Tax=Pseudomonas jilinensis TaxID=2078689 RepID=A0A396S1P8_9PSED|nr:cellulose biosynthesis cyclic di-GMP-binding regulatory protein BcsB [Pseudomonas jilinensis]PAU87155.1 cellulose biosynthesis cyclic di-GMP-binding regulatory protein BcsB [Pseudomonas sp. WN033]RHW22690.1 cellulose biosynthesis cyclic di-GMP-binding regulatory protein BcsB [Pseudomonas jilinensis]
MSRFKYLLIVPVALLALASVNAQEADSLPDETAQPVTEEVVRTPTWISNRTFGELGDPRDSLLLGIHNSQQIEFTLRRDRIASDASLMLDYTPSPALLPNLSHLRVYLNDVLMGTVVIDEEQLGTRTRRQVALAPYLLSDFNRVRLEFIGHYTDICEDPGNSALWLNVAHGSQISLREHAVALRNDLAFFPLPFFDSRDHGKTQVHMVFHDQPTLGEQKAAGVLASYFGSLAGWRGTEFPVLFDRLPSTGVNRDQVHSSVVFAANDRRPSFLADLERFPAVEAPVVELIDHPEHSYSKVLVIWGRDEQDLLDGARALALGGNLFRGSRVVINEVQTLQPRKPYDAPNWTPTDRPVRFAELIDYPTQLHTSGLQPRPITVDINLPPDLFVWRNQGIPLQTKYRYTPPATKDESRLSISLNDQFITSLSLSRGTHNRLERMRLAVTAVETANAQDRLLVPSLKLGARNTLRYDFSFASTYGSAQRDFCQTSLPVDTRALIDEDSSIDLSGYYHYMAMPDLWAFAHSGFPFSRMADLSETLVIVPSAPSAVQLSTLLEILASVGARTGYPAMAFEISDDWSAARQTNADLLVLGSLAPDLHDRSDLNLVLERSSDWIMHASSPLREKVDRIDHTAFPADSRVDVTARAPIAAIAGMQSPFHNQRSVVAFMANDDADFSLLRETLGDSGKLDAVRGSVAVIRESGVQSQLVGPQYFVGYLPWWLKLWYLLSNHPVWLAVMAVLCMLLAAFLLWQALRWVSERRLHQQD